MKVTILSLIVIVCFIAVHYSDGCRSQSSTPTTTATTTTSYYYYNGILVSGGWPRGAQSSTEVFIPDTGKSCNLPDLPDQRYYHTMDTLGNTPVICGGGIDRHYSCIQFTPTSSASVWTNYTTTMEERKDHTSWVSSSGLVLVGGYYAGTNSEIVPSGGRSFSLLKNTMFACAITNKDFTIITGGLHTKKVVAKYNLEGHVEDLPELNTGRQNHGCGSYYSGGTMVLIVAGGYDTGSNRAYESHFGTTMSSTEKLTTGATAWTTIKPLPRKLSYVASVSMQNKIYLTGGLDDEGGARAEILAFDGEDWKEVGQLQWQREGHAATMVDTSTIMGFCK